MKTLARSALSLALASVLVVSFAPDASAQSGRLSLSERIAKLEAQNQGQSGGTMVDLLNRVNQLQSEVQSLRGLVESQAFEIEELKKRARDQYVDLDSRMARLESGGAMRPAAPSGYPTAPAQTAPAQAAPAPAQPGQLMMEPDASTAPQASTTPPMDTLEPTALATTPEPAAIDASSAPLPPPAVPATSLPSQTGDEQASYDTAFAALREGRYAESARRFSGFLQQFPNGDLADNATYWLGESYYVTQNYRIALDTFRTLLDRFPQSAKAPDALLKLGYCHYELQEWSQAEAALNQVVQRYPDTTVARLAQGRLRALRLEGRTP
jgi:tol-pal system protein YbgF